MKTTYIYIALIVIVVGGIAAARFYSERAPSPYTALAQCIAESGATFFGAFWCPHCIEQKAMFGSAQDLLPYTECSTPDRQGQLPICQDENIRSYPTWRFSDGSELTGAIAREELAAKTGCELPST